MHNDYAAIVAAPFAALGIRVEQGRLTAIDFLPATTRPMAARESSAAAVAARLHAYLQAAGTPLDLSAQPAGSAFQQRVWNAIRQIPPGSTITYGELARRVGSGARAVANACGANPIPLIIPCHRVVAKHDLGGFMGGRQASSLAIKRWLLSHERRQSNAAG